MVESPYLERRLCKLVSRQGRGILFASQDRGTQVKKHTFRQARPWDPGKNRYFSLGRAVGSQVKMFIFARQGSGTQAKLHTLCQTVRPPPPLHGLLFLRFPRDFLQSRWPAVLCHWVPARWRSPSRRPKSVFSCLLRCNLAMFSLLFLLFSLRFGLDPH